MNENYFDHFSAEELGFSATQKLEVVNPNNSSEMCVGTIKAISNHVLVIELDDNISEEPLFFPAQSMNIFPAGWSKENDITLLCPANYKSLMFNGVSSSNTESEKKSPISEKLNMKCNDDDNNSPDCQLQSMWCQRLYINHWCHCGPLLSKNKVF